MKRGIYIIVIIALLIGLTSAFGCSASKETMEGNTPETEGFSTVVQMNGKELTVGALGIELPGGQRDWACRPGVVTVVVKNSGREPIAVAELELVGYMSDGVEYERYMVLSVKGLGRGEVQILHWDVYGTIVHDGSSKVQVRRLE